MNHKKHNVHILNTNQPHQYDSQQRVKKSKYLNDTKKTQQCTKDDKYQTTVDRLMRQRTSFRQKQNYPENIPKNIRQSYSQLNKFDGQERQGFVDFGKQIMQKPRRYAYIKSVQSQRQNEQSMDQISDYDRNISPKSIQQDTQSLYPSHQKNYNQYQQNRSLSRNDTFVTMKKTEHQRSSFQIQKNQNYSHQRERSDIDRIYQLERQLQEERYKFKVFQQQTIENQVKVLQTINSMEMKLKSVHEQNLLLKQKNQELKKCQKQDTQCYELKNLLQQKQAQLQQLTKQHKKIKDIGRGIVQMMKKVDLIEVPPQQDEVKFAWRWLKKVVWEYEGIRKKALIWKIAYEELHQDSVDSQDSLNI